MLTVSARDTAKASATPTMSVATTHTVKSPPKKSAMTAAELGTCIIVA